MITVEYGIIIKEGVEKIKPNAFYLSSALKNVELPQSIAFIGYDAFAYCPELSKVKYRGSEDQWSEASISPEWAANSGAYTLVYNYTE